MLRSYTCACVSKRRDGFCTRNASGLFNRFGDYLVKIKKRSGSMEDFDKAKLKVSLKKAGSEKEHATKITESVARKV